MTIWRNEHYLVVVDDPMMKARYEMVVLASSDRAARQTAAQRAIAADFMARHDDDGRFGVIHELYLVGDLEATAEVTAEQHAVAWPLASLAMVPRHEASAQAADLMVAA